MTRLQRWQSVVLQATALAALGFVINHEINRSHRHDESLWNDPVLKNYTSTFQWAKKSTNSTSRSSMPYNDTPTNRFINDLGRSNSTKSQEQPSFYLATLPQNIIAQAIITFLSYHWHLALERLLPARSAGVEIQSEKEVINEDEGREEEIVRRWILKGRIQRSSISWLNTFLKWVIDMTLGIIWTSIVYQVIYVFIFRKFLTHFLRNTILSSLIMIFSLRPLISLIGFIVIPAPRRPVFLAGMSALAGIFVTVSTMIVLRGIVKSNFIQKAMMDATERAWREAQRKDATTARFVDEL